METGITRRETPEEKELIKKKAELKTLEGDLAQHELDLATLKAELHNFENIYLRIVGIRYSELDEIEAEIAEALVRLNPEDNRAQERAAEARTEAQESAEATGDIQEKHKSIKFCPSENLKKLYREVAKLVHPDLATDEEDRIRRQRLMADVNRAYEDGDEERLKAILREWEDSPESVQGEGTGVELVRTLRKIARVEERLGSIEIEINQLKESDLYKLRVKVEEAEKEGRDLLAEMSEQIENQIADARKQLTEVKERSKK